MGCLTFIDGSDEEMGKMQQSAEKFPALLKTRYNVCDAVLVDVKDKVNPYAAMRAQIRYLVEQQKVSSIFLNLVVDGDDETAEFEGGELGAADLLEILKEFSQCKFTVRTASRFGAGLEDAMEQFTDSVDRPGRITVFIPGKDRMDDPLEKIGTQEYATLYEAALISLLADPQNKDRSYGTLHLQADIIAKTFTLRNPSVWRSWGKSPHHRLKAVASPEHQPEGL